MKVFVRAIIIGTFVSSSAFAVEPRCDGPNNWPAANTFAQMKNSGLIKNNLADFKLTKVERIASEKIGKDLWKQVHLVKYFRKDGSVLKAIAVANASLEECSMSDVKIYIVSGEL
jgi:hypothetical protein